MPRHCVRAGTLRLWRKETALAQALKRCAGQARLCGLLLYSSAALVGCVGGVTFVSVPSALPGG
jgi:hypothetical protein